MCFATVGGWPWYTTLAREQGVIPRQAAPFCGVVGQPVELCGAPATGPAPAPLS